MTPLITFSSPAASQPAASACLLTSLESDRFHRYCLKSFTLTNSRKNVTITQNCPFSIFCNDKHVSISRAPSLSPEHSQDPTIIMSLKSFAVLLVLSLTCLGCAIFSLVGSTEWRRSFYIVWTVFASMMVYGVLCYGILIYWWKSNREKSLRAARKGQSSL